jgi:hypothetical protein
MKERAGVRFSTMAEVAHQWKRQHPLKDIHTSRTSR